MSEPIPESIPTSADPRSRRPLKKARGPGTPTSLQSAALAHLFEKQPEIVLPSTASSALTRYVAPPPEIVANVQGSSAGAGSGEFHVYKASRRREYERVKAMEDESKKEEADRAWAQKVEENRRKDEAKVGKNAKRREKLKARKARGKGEGEGVDGKGGVDLEAGRPVDLEGERDENGEMRVVEEQGIVIHDED